MNEFCDYFKMKNSNFVVLKVRKDMKDKKIA